VARLEDIRKAGKNPFGSYTVPQAVLKFKQGFGRLIRCSTDRGVVVVLDPRIVTMRYGRTFLASLPETGFARGPTEEVLRRVEEFFRPQPSQRTIS
jgi:ATP-dependent DNA helicase DinG